MREPRTFLQAVSDLLDAVTDDNTNHGGLISRTTIRLSDEIRAQLNRERRRRGEPVPPEPFVPRQPRGAL